MTQNNLTSDEQLMEDIFTIIYDADKQTKIDAKFVFNYDMYQRIESMRDSDGAFFTATSLLTDSKSLCGFPVEIDNDCPDGEIKLVSANSIISNLDDKDFHNA